MVAGTLIRATRQLGKGDNRHIQLLRHDFEISGHFRNLLNTVLDASARGHQLKVVDDNQTQIGDSAQLGLHLRHRDASAVVNVHRHPGNRLCRYRQTSPVVYAQIAGTQLGALNQRIRRQHTGDQLLPAHLQREHRYRISLLCNIGCDIHDEG